MQEQFWGRSNNFYVPAGGDEPDPAVNLKFAHKLAFLDEMRGWLTGTETDRQAILVGDPGRALLLAQELLEQPKMSNHARGLWGYSGATPEGR